MHRRPLLLAAAAAVVLAACATTKPSTEGPAANDEAPPPAAEEAQTGAESSEPAESKPAEPDESAAGYPEPKVHFRANDPEGYWADKALLSLNSRPWAEVRVNGELLGKTPIMNMPIEPGATRIEVDCTYCIPPEKQSVELTAEAGRTAVVQVFFLSP